MAHMSQGPHALPLCEKLLTFDMHMRLNCGARRKRDLCVQTLMRGQCSWAVNTAQPSLASYICSSQAHQRLSHTRQGFRLLAVDEGFNLTTSEVASAQRLHLHGWNLSFGSLSWQSLKPVRLASHRLAHLGCSKTEHSLQVGHRSAARQPQRQTQAQSVLRWRPARPVGRMRAQTRAAKATAQAA